MINEDLSEHEIEPPNTFNATINDVVLRIHELNRAIGVLAEEKGVTDNEMIDGLIITLTEEVNWLTSQLQATWDASDEISEEKDLTNNTKGMYIGDDAFEDVVVVEDEDFQPPAPKKKSRKRRKASK